MSFDPSRLYTALLNTGLQQKDNALYQVIHDLIGTVSAVNKQTNTIISGGGSVGPQGLQGLHVIGPPGLDGENGEDSLLNLNPSINNLISSFTQGSVIFAGPSGFLAQDNANLFWDNTNKRLGIKTTTPATELQVIGGAAIGGDWYNNVVLSVGLNGNTLSQTHQVGVYSALHANSFADGAGSFNGGFETAIGTQAGAFTIEKVANFAIGSIGKGAGSTITRTWGLSTHDETAGTYNATIAIFDAVFVDDYFIYYTGTRKSVLAGGDLIAPIEIYRSSASSYIRFSGGSVSQGGNFLLFGESHATLANTAQFNASGGLFITAPTKVTGTLVTTGYVGIGTLVPFAKLTVGVGTASDYGVNQLDLAVKLSSPVGVIFEAAGDDSGLIIKDAAGVFNISTTYGSTGSYRKIQITPGNNAVIVLQATGTGNVGIRVTVPTAILHIAAGTATASTAPFKLTSGVNLTTPESGVIEYNGTDFFLTP
jgi:hypothetical protein